MIIGIGGRARSGKGSVGKIFIKHYGFTELNFADPLKELCSSTFNLPKEYFYSDELKDKPFDEPLKTTEDQLCFFLSKIFDLIDSKRVDEEDGCNVYQVYGILPMYFISPRHILQFMGTDVARKMLGDDIWLKVYKEAASKIEGHIVCTDIRFPNEHKLIKELGGTTAIVVRPNLQSSVPSHESEKVEPIEAFDVMINNDCDLSNLQEYVKMWMTLRFPGRNML